MISEGKLRRLRIGDRTICIGRTQTGFYAIQDQCPHRAVSLSEGHLNFLEEVVCPWHNYRYSIRTGREANQLTADAKVFPLRWQDGKLQIGLPS